MRTLVAGLILVGLMVLLAVSPLFPPGLPSIADAPIHLFRTMELVSIWSDGVYFPRWAPNLAFGLGYPLFNFAPPLPYFLAGGFHVLGFSLENSIKLLAVLCMAIYGFGMYLFARNVLSERGALLAAAAYLFTPFRFRESLLYGGNYPQILAIGLFPWVLWAFERTINDGRWRYVLAGALCYAALILSHNFHAFIFTPLLLVYVAVETLSRKKWGSLSATTQTSFGLLRMWWPPLAVLCLGLMLTAFFWAPALFDVQYTYAQADYYLTRSDFRLRLLSLGDLLAMPMPLDGRADNPYVPFSLGVVIVLLAVLGVVYLALAWLCLAFFAYRCADRMRMRCEIPSLAFFLVVLLGAAGLMLRPAAPLWETLPFLPYAEFPWRLMGIANLAAAVLAGGSLRLWEWAAQACQRLSRLPDLALAVSVLGVILGVAVYFYPTRPFQRWSTPTLSDYIGYELATQNIGTTGLAEYLPRWAEEIPTSSPLVNLLREGTPVEKLDRSALPDGARATALWHSSTGDRYQFKSEDDFRARFFTLYFPGWRAFLDGEPAPIAVSSPLGLISVSIPAGDHELVLRFGETPFRLAMDIISVIALLGLLAWLVIKQRGGRTYRGGEPGVNVSGPEHRSSQPDLGRPWGLSGQAALGLLLAVLVVAKVGFVDLRTTWFRRVSPPDQVVGAQHPMRVSLEDNVLFLGYDLQGDEALRPGGLLHVRLYWQATGPLEDDYVSFIHLDAPPDNVTFVTNDNYHPGDPQAQNDVPSSGWNPALYVRDEHRLNLPDEILPIAYALNAGLYERETGRRLAITSGQGEAQTGDTIYLQQIHVLPARPIRPSEMQSGRRYRLGESIELLGHSVEIEGSAGEWLKPGQTITVRLFWQAAEPLSGDYTVFVHLLDEAGQVHGQSDSRPMNGRYPTYDWSPHQVVVDETTLAVAPEIPPGDYRLAVGMYELATGQRLPVTGENGDVPNGSILLEPVLRVKN